MRMKESKFHSRVEEALKLIPQANRLFLQNEFMAARKGVFSFDFQGLLLLLLLFICILFRIVVEVQGVCRKEEREHCPLELSTCFRPL